MAKRVQGRFGMPAAVASVLGAVATLGLWAGCGAPEPTAVGDLVPAPGGRARFIADDPQVLTERSDWYERRETFDWDLRRSAEAEAWRTGQRVERRNDGSGGLYLRVAQGGVSVRRDGAGIEAAMVSTVTVDAAVGGRMLELQWARPGQNFDAERSLRLPRATAENDETPTYRFEVAEHPFWQGDVGRLRLRTGAGPDGLRIVRVRGQRQVLTSSARKAADGEPEKIELAHEVRNVFLSQPGVTIERHVVVPPGARLGFGYAIDPEVRGPITLRVRVATATDGGGDDASPEPDTGAADGVVAFEKRITTRGAEAIRGWTDEQVPLTRWAGQRVLVRLETMGDEAARSQGFALWAHPEVVVPVDAPRPSVLLISIDTLRADRLSHYGYERPTTPNLDRWATERAITFRHAVAAAPWTLPSHVSMLTGIDAFRHGINHDVGRLDSGELTAPHTVLDSLAERLRRAGWATGGMTGGAYVHPQYGFAQGFDRYGYWPNRARDAEELSTGVDHALAFLAQHRGTPAFFFLHTYAVHDPYKSHGAHLATVAPDRAPLSDALRVALHAEPPDPDNGFRQVNGYEIREAKPPRSRRATADDRALITDTYDAGVAAADAEIGRLFAALEDQALDAGLTTIVTSDHGEALDTAGRVGHVDLYDVTLLVPLMMALPGAPHAGRIIDDQVRSVDIVPTLLEVLDQPPADNLDGVSLLPLLDGVRGHVPPEAWSYAASSNRGLSLRYGNRLKLIMPNSVWPPRGAPEIYELATDPDERADRFATWSTERRQVLLDQARAHLDRARGVTLTIRNREEVELRARIEGAMVRPVATKSPDLACDCLRWVDMGKADLVLPPGEAVTVRFEKIFGRRLSVEGNLGSATFDHTFDVRDLEGVAWLRLDGGRWATGRADQPSGSGTGFEVAWRGDRTATEGPAAVDEELRRQLEALGYLN